MELMPFDVASFICNQIEQITDVAVSLYGMAEWLSLEDAIMVSTSDPFPLNESFFLQVLDDPLHRPLSDPDVNSDFPEYFFRVRS